MKIYSIYPTMVQSAEIIPPDVNVKLILRHSYRPSIKGIDNSDNISLTIKGKEMAFKFGLGLCCPIGVIYSSQLLRCIQTCQFILKGTCISNTTTINTIDMRRFYSSDLVLSEKTFHQEKNGKLVVSKMLNNDILPGFISIEKCANRQLDFIFGIGNKKSTIDIFCTHDFQLMCLISWLYNYSSDVDLIRKEWPQMLEGVFIWGNRDDFYCVWRSNIKHFINNEECID